MQGSDHKSKEAGSPPADPTKKPEERELFYPQGLREEEERLIEQRRCAPGLEGKPQGPSVARRSPAAGSAAPPSASNTGVYELIRRRVPYIICCDCGADPEYRFEDVGNLVRKARIDFDARIDVLGQVALDALLKEEAIPEAVRKELGALEEFAAAEKRRHGLLAGVGYPEGGECSVILFVKPALTGSEPADLRHYHQTNPTFPNEPTSDQFFDEARWESYRALGEHSGERLLARGARGGWWFLELDRARLSQICKEGMGRQARPRGQARRSIAMDKQEEQPMVDDEAIEKEDRPASPPANRTRIVRGGTS